MGVCFGAAADATFGASVGCYPLAAAALFQPLAQKAGDLALGIAIQGEDDFCAQGLLPSLVGVFLPVRSSARKTELVMPLVSSALHAFGQNN